MNATALSIADQMRHAWNACNSVLGCSVQRTDAAIYSVRLRAIVTVTIG